VRRALGARQGDLIVQFMLESLYLSGIGAIVGVVLGVAGMDLFARYGFDAIVSFTAIRVAVSVALGCGVVFGVYPAINASMVPPVEALRSN
jgi:putative ABC transport system permease protein